MSAMSLPRAEFLQLASDNDIFKYVQVISIAILVYEAAMFFTEEVDLVWRARWTSPKALHLLSRISPFFDAALRLFHCFAPSPTAKTCGVTNTLLIGIHSS